MNRKILPRLLTMILALLLMNACTSESDPYIDHTALVILEDEAIALADAPAPESELLHAEASGTAQKTSDSAVIDYSNASCGYVMARYTAKTDKRLKAQIKGPSVTYTYNLTPGQWAVFPLAEGDGSYTVTMFINASGNQYAALLSTTVTAKLTDEFLPFLYPNQYVDYTAAPETIKKAVQLTEYAETTLDQVALIYDFVVDTLTYDTEKASSVKSGYLPVLDQVLAEEKGICFDYAALMAGMLRSQGIPTKLVVGYAGKSYHAWINVWTEEEGWIDGIIRFDGSTWQRMDPTFASSASRSSSIMDYIGDGTNYTAKYLY